MMDWTKPKDPNELPQLPVNLIGQCIAIWYEEDERQGWRDAQGRAWRLARTSDGKWWKTRRFYAADGR